MEMRLAFIGFGKVARAFAQMLTEHQQALAERYALQSRTTAIATANHGCITSATGIDLLEATACVEQGGRLEELRGSLAVPDAFVVTKSCDADILFETLPLNAVDGEPAITHIRSALERRICVITANKGPIAFAYSELKSLAHKTGPPFRFEGTVMG